jgi:uncharacterized membrane protein YkvI
MQTLIWTAVLLMLTVACATVGAAALIGFPIAGVVPFVLLFAWLGLARWGAALSRLDPTLTA